MDKATLLNAIVSTGQERSFRATVEWQNAFNAYNAIHKTGKRPSCSSCFRDVLAWLRS